MWKWLEKNHPILYEAIWWGILSMNIVTIIISCVSIALAVVRG